ncbi:asparagine synthase-related protein [Streptomyces sp900129855]|uniref:Asparagine synthase-related protein n=1 Tax=Streptomyces sp. 900129855 TaxID=3155129 RepID=A0ABV3A093_9ACTN
MCHPAQGKRILRDAAKALGLPREVWASRDKLGFASPVPAWLNGDFAEWADVREMGYGLLDRPPDRERIARSRCRLSSDLGRCRL